MNEATPPPGADGFELVLRVTRDAVHGPAGSMPIASRDLLAHDFLLLLLRETADVSLERALAYFGYTSRATYAAKLRRYLAHGIPGLRRDRPGPQHNWRRSEAVIKRIVALRFADPNRGPREIMQLLAAAGLHVSLRSVERTLTEYGLSRRGGG